MSAEPIAPADFYTGLVAEVYRHTRSETFDPAPYAKFIERSGEPALELGCGDGDPILDLRERGLDVEGLDSSADMLDRCRAAATERGLDVTLHHATFEAMQLDRQYRSIFLAGATFNLLPDDEVAERALTRIAAHLEPGGSALIPLFIPQRPGESTVGNVQEHLADDGSVMSVTVTSFARDDDLRTQRMGLRYEMRQGESLRTTEREWILHWFERDAFASMAERVGLVVAAVFDEEQSPTTTHDTAFTFLLHRPNPDA